VQLTIVSHASHRVHFFAYDDEGKELYQCERDCVDEEAFAHRYRRAFAKVLKDHEEAKWQARRS
jgi:hypothetical protein